ncbi:MAG: tyrosine-protein phosphatase [Spirochaetaceae bacterium]|jgi:protein-tyrosine phosphatase|nr:tyrosine-protein phosphatase [Spirochaetaceae bacterium]
MKKKIECAALAVLLTALTGCYQEVELDPRQPGDTLPIAGAYNVRDVGGYQTTDGKTVKTGLLYRSGDLNRLFDRDTDYLFYELGIKTVVDFRSVTERAENPDIRRNKAVDVHLPIEDNYVAPYSRVTTDGTSGDDVMLNGYTYLGGGSYTYTPRGGTATTRNGADTNGSIDQYKAFFTELKNADKPLLFHCSAGKDRTGVAAAFLLAILGVDKETIISDYLKSGEYVKDKYYPVVPAIKKQMSSMYEAKATADKLKNEAGTAYDDRKVAGFKSQVEARVIAEVKKAFIAGGMDAAQVNVMGKDALNGVLTTGGQDTIDTQVARQVGQIQQIGMMSYEQIDGQINATATGVTTLLSVKREYITKALNTASGKNIDADSWSDVVAGITTKLALSPADIGRLKAKYLN